MVLVLDAGPFLAILSSTHFTDVLSSVLNPSEEMQMSRSWSWNVSNDGPIHWSAGIILFVDGDDEISKEVSRPLSLTLNK